MSSRPDKIHDVALASGHHVRLPEWQDLAPPVHGARMEHASYNPRNGERPQFYDSTAEWMRNESARGTMPSANAQIDQQHIRLFYFPTTGTWHASDALDIDHVRPWRDHLIAKEVDNRADAIRAYNDIDNLRVVPSFYNRARDSADGVLAQHGADSQAWRQWVDTRIGFDPSAQPEPFDAERDLARRTKATTGQEWTEDHTRSDLSFDKKVLEKWFDHALHQSYAGSVKVDNPVTGQTDTVPLFRCGASGQLTTRDALDIDHAIPFEIVADQMHRLFPEHVITKADMLDVYNDTSNLRLVTRGVNSSHEFEMDGHGQWRDAEAPERRNEFRGWLREGPPLDEQARSLIREHFSGHEAQLPKPAPEGLVNHLIPRHHDEENLLPQTPEARAAAQARLTTPDSPYHATYGKVSTAVEGMIAHDPKLYAAMQYFNNGQPPAPGHVEHMATSLIAAAKERGMTQIDGIVSDEKRQTLFAYQGDGQGGIGNRVDVPLRAAMQFTVEENTQRVHKVDQRVLEQQQGPPLQFAQPHSGLRQ